MNSTEISLMLIQELEEKKELINNGTLEVLDKEEEELELSIINEKIANVSQSLFNAEKQARELLSKRGFAVNNLWQNGDVISKYKCDNLTAQKILEQALLNESTMEQIWFEIEMEAESLDLEKIGE